MDRCAGRPGRPSVRGDPDHRPRPAPGLRLPASRRDHRRLRGAPHPRPRHPDQLHGGAGVRQRRPLRGPQGAGVGGACDQGRAALDGPPRSSRRGPRQRLGRRTASASRCRRGDRPGRGSRCLAGGRRRRDDRPADDRGRPPGADPVLDRRPDGRARSAPPLRRVRPHRGRRSAGVDLRRPPRGRRRRPDRARDHRRARRARRTERAVSSGRPGRSGALPGCGRC